LALCEGNITAAAAHAHAREVLQREPAFTAEGFLGALHYQQHSDKEHLRDGLVKAGLPALFNWDYLPPNGLRLLPWYRGIVRKYNIRLAFKVICSAP
jgi:hypothetical protein